LSLPGLRAPLRRRAHQVRAMGKWALLSPVQSAKRVFEKLASVLKER
jgi:hypothetical protein